MHDLSVSEDRILRLIKFRGEQATAAIARELDVTVPGARKHLAALVEKGLLRFEDRPGKVGRPERYWKLTSSAQSLFPDSHSLLTVEMVESVRTLFGEDGLDRLIDARERTMLARYGSALAAAPDHAGRIRALADVRTEEGYMAEARPLPDGAWLLAENHCPICAAATACKGFCRSELALFSRLLGDAVTVERTDYILAGARRCAYRIAPVEGDAG